EAGTTTGTSYTFTGLTPATEYTFRVTAFDTKGNESPLSVALIITTENNPSDVDVTVPSIPENLKLVICTATEIFFSWDNSTDNVGVAGYRILRDDIETGESIKNSYIDTELEPETEYHYKVSAFDDEGNESEFSTEFTASTSSEVDHEQPSRPENLSAQSVGDTYADLIWDASTDNTMVIGYKIYRNDNEIDFTTSTAYTDNNLDPSTNYIFNVSSVDISGNRSFRSADLYITTTVLNSIEEIKTLNCDISYIIDYPEKSYMLEASSGLNQIKLIDVSGKVIFIEYPNSVSEFYFDLPSIKSGIYFLYISSNTSELVIKIPVF
ncbi:MAG: fibronectin type III domain-containing protein, partial [Bacteroidales bacterium]|nr:fibronectin type III domain-containing protein [Bacteroidales bacterium]